MSVPRLLLLSLLIALCVATAAAQSSPDNTSNSSQLLPALPQNAEASTALIEFHLPLSHLDGLSLSPTTRTTEREDDSLVMRPLDSSMQHILTLEQNEATCYTLRTYRVARVSPESDSTRPAGYSTCQRATRFQLRIAVDSQEIKPR
jgi:hypothetical protein